MCVPRNYDFGLGKLVAWALFGLVVGVPLAAYELFRVAYWLWTHVSVAWN